MNFKQQLDADIARVFLNPDEFAEYISIEDVPETPAVCDWSAQPEGEHLYGDPGDTWGVNAVHAEITLAEGVIPTPEPGQELLINGRSWTVRRAVPQQGLLILNVYRNVA